MIYLASDHAGYALKEELKKWLERAKKPYTDLTPELVEGDDYPDSAKLLAEALKTDSKGRGVALCGTGVGMSIALNRYKWVRAVLSTKREVVRLSRQHNNSNVLCLSGRFVTYKKAIALTKVFLATPFSDDQRHVRRIEKLT
jgi:ribose 5-phosphate isomerase B